MFVWIVLVPWLYVAVFIAWRRATPRQKSPIPENLWAKNIATVLAAAGHRWGRVFRLLDHGADPHSAKEYTLLQHAAMQRKFKNVCRLLDDFDVDPNIVGRKKTGPCPLVAAVRNNHYPMVRKLLQHGAHPVPEALFYACRDGKKCMADLLLMFGADPNGLIQIHGTHLTLPVAFALLAHGRPHMLGMLHDYGLDLNVMGGAGKSLLEAARGIPGCERLVAAIEKLI